MTHSPPVPEGNTSPYPIEEPPHEAPAVNLPVVRQQRAENQPIAAIGAAIVAGVAAIVGGLLLWRGRRR